MSGNTEPVDQTDEFPPPPPPVSEPQRALPTPFLTKTYQMVEDPTVNEVISWNDDGSAFVVWRPAEFALDLLPKYFKHNNFSSFVRQLNTYGFRKIVPDRWEFSNDSFKRGEKRLLCDIHRRKIGLPAVAVAVAVPLSSALAIPAKRSGSPANLSGSSTNSVEVQGEQLNLSSSQPAVTAGSVALQPGSSADLVDENERLRKENRELTNELAQLKNICNNIFLLMSKYATGEGPGHPPAEALELMPVRRILEEAEEICMKSDETLHSATAASGSSAWFYEANPTLFGVSIGEKRYRGEEDCDEEQTTTTNLPEVKLEQIDSDAAEEQQPWVVYYPRAQRVCTRNDRASMERDE